MTEVKKSNIAASFLVNAPSGEYDQCVASLRGLTSSKIVKSAVNQSLEKHLHRTYATIDIKDGTGNNVIMCNETRVSPDGYYLNANDFTLFKFDFETREVTEKSVAVINSPLPSTVDKNKVNTKINPIRTELQSKLSNYVRHSYKSKYAAAVIESNGNSKSKNTFDIILRSNSCSLKNFRTGSLIAKYVYDHDNGKLSGKITASQHYFEHGNAVASNECDFNAEIGKTKGLYSSNVDEVVAKISEFENTWFMVYNGALERIATDGVTRFRRKAAITGTKINWEMELKGLGGFGH